MNAIEHTVHCRSNVGRLREALVKHPSAAFRSQAELDRSWQSLGYLDRPDFAAAIAEYDAFEGILRDNGVQLHHLPSDSTVGPDSLYTHDPATAVSGGLVLGRMGKAERRNEPAAVASWAAAAGMPVMGSVPNGGLMEGGDVIWLDPDTLAAGIGYRTNQAGAEQLGRLANAEVIQVSLPHWKGPGDVLHLMSLISPLDVDLALVYRPLLPVPFVQLLERRGVGLVDVPEAELDTLGCNVLALAPRKCLVVEGNPETRKRLEAAGCEVISFSGREIAVKGQGGPTCLTRPTLRD